MRLEPCRVICGAVFWDDRPVGALVGRMASALRPEGTAEILEPEPGVAFGIVGPEALDANGSQNSTGRTTAAADAAIYNAKDVVGALGLKGPVSIETLISEAYSCWGEEFAARLIGDFAIAVWDSAQRTLLLCRDHLGIRPLYMRRHQGGLVFSSEVKGLSPFTDDSGELDPAGLARLAAGPGGASWNGYRGTLFSEVESLPPAAAVVISSDGERTRDYWRPQPRPNLGARRDDDLLAEFRSILKESVSGRLPEQGTPMCLLSGGLDSSGILSLALQTDPREIVALSSVPQAPVVDSGDSDDKYIGLFERREGVTVRRVTAPGAGPFDDVERLISAYETPQAARTHYLYSAFADEALTVGSNVILDGLGGEYGPSFHANGYFPELLLHGRWPTLTREVVARARRTDRTVAGVLRQELFKPFLQPPGRAPGNVWRRVLNASFVERYAQVSVPQVRRQRAFDLRSAHERMVRAAAKSSRVAGFRGYETVRFRFPYLDVRLLEFCLGLPSHMKVRDGYTRYLIRRGLDGILPPEIQWRTTKAPFAPDFHLRYAAQKPVAAAVFDSVRPGDPVGDIVDVGALRQSLELDVTTSRITSEHAFEAMSSVVTGVYAIHFLRRFPALQN